MKSRRIAMLLAVEVRGAFGVTGCGSVKANDVRFHGRMRIIHDNWLREAHRCG